LPTRGLTEVEIRQYLGQPRIGSQREGRSEELAIIGYELLPRAYVGDHRVPGALQHGLGRGIDELPGDL
jgi:hypothetical protein